MLVEEIMSDHVVTVQRNVRVTQVANIMSKKKIGMLLVMDDDDKLEGVITDSDIISRVVALDKDGEKLFAKDIMTEGVITIGSTSLVSEAAEVLSNYNLKRLPVLRDGKIVGVVSNTDIVKTLARIKATLTGIASAF